VSHSGANAASDVYVGRGKSSEVTKMPHQQEWSDSNWTFFVRFIKRIIADSWRGEGYHHTNEMGPGGA
jgi:hypothetical protein